MVSWLHAAAIVSMCRIRPRAAAVLLAACLAMTCGGPRAAAEQVNACTVAPAGDIQAALGIAAIGEGRATDIGVRHTCDWTLANHATLRVAVFTSPKAETLTSSASPERAWQPVRGLGQQAGYRRYNFTPLVTVEEVQVVLAQHRFFVQVTGKADEMPAESALIDLARKVAGRLS